jgi:nitrate/nitrite-specific signal transduction histidine kinase
LLVIPALGDRFSVPDVAVTGAAAVCVALIRTMSALFAVELAVRPALIDAASCLARPPSHDGAQQHLVLLGLKLSLARRQVENDPGATAILDELSEGLNQALSELRDLAHGIYPAVLENEGLAAALREAVGRAAILQRSIAMAPAATRPSSKGPSTSAAWRRSRTPPSTQAKTRGRRYGSRNAIAA